VLYASSQRIGAFIEVLARYRTDPALVAAYAEMTDDDDAEPTIPPGIVPADWPSRRHIGVATHPGPFADIGHSDSLAFLRIELASRLLHYGLDDLDGGELRRRAPRSLTQEISRYVFARGVDADGRSFAGVRYLSRLGDDLENWAIFEGTEPDDTWEQATSLRLGRGRKRAPDKALVSAGFFAALLLSRDGG